MAHLKHWIWIGVLVCSTHASFANSSPGLWDTEWEQSADAALGYGPKGQLSSALSYTPYLKFFFTRARVGLGPRFFHVHGFKTIRYQPENDSTNDTSFITYDQDLFAFNLAAHASYEVFVIHKHSFELGLNIDVIGIGFGQLQKARYVSQNLSLNGIQGANVPLMNLLTFVNDRGQLNSEFFVAYYYDQSWGVRVGYSMYHLSVNSDLPLEGGNTKFMTSVDQIFVAGQYRF